MRLMRLFGIFCIAACAAAALPAHAESAGKVLTAGGDALVLRGSQILRLSPGAAIESGDQIHTGTDSKVLIVFTDSGLVWIPSNSDFVVDEYSYAQGGRGAAFFSLLKGGARSVTGLIGRRNRSSFRLRVPVATIGIRGTDFSVVMCQRDCRDADGSATAGGLYGEVIEGRIAVTPLEDRLLEREFGAGESFHLADERSSPTPMFLPPPFLRSMRDEQTRFTDKTGIAVAPLAPILSGPGTAAGGGLPVIGGVVGGLTGTVSNALGGSLIGTLEGTLQSLPVNLTGALPGLTTGLPLVGGIGLPPIGPITTPIGLPGVTPAPILPPISPPGGIPIAVPVLPPTSPIPVAPITTPIAPPIALPVPPITTPIIPPIGLH
jgi:hypothetical protein